MFLFFEEIYFLVYWLGIMPIQRILNVHCYVLANEFEDPGVKNFLTQLTLLDVKMWHPS